MPLPADLPALSPTRLVLAAALVLLAGAAGAAEAKPAPAPKPAPAAPKPAAAKPTTPKPAAAKPATASKPAAAAPKPAAPAAAPPPPAQAADAAVPTALTAQGSRVSGPPSLAAGTIALGGVGLPLDRLVALDVPGESGRWIDQGVLLADGQLLRGAPRGLQDGTLTIACDIVGLRTFPAEAVAAIILAPVEARDPLAGSTGAAGAVLANGDRVAGTIAFINDASIGVDTGRKVTQVPRHRARLAVLRAATRAPGTWMRLAGGDLLRGELTAFAPEGVALTSPGLDRLAFPMAAVRALWAEGKAVRPLTLAPTAEGSTAPGAPEAIAGRRAERGFTIAAGGGATAADAGAWATLVGEVAVPAGSAGATCRVLVDGQAAYDSGELAPGAPAKPFTVRVQGASEVRLTVSAAAETIGARAVWAYPTLVQ